MRLVLAWLAGISGLVAAVAALYGWKHWGHLMLCFMSGGLAVGAGIALKAPWFAAAFFGGLAGIAWAFLVWLENPRR